MKHVDSIKELSSNFLKSDNYENGEFVFDYRKCLTAPSFSQKFLKQVNFDGVG